MPDLDIAMLFDGWTPVIRTLVLGTLAYASLVILLRISGKRTLSKMNAFDSVVTIAFGSTLASIMTSSQVSLIQGVVALGLLILLQLVNTVLSVYSEGYRKLIKAQPTLLFYHGEFLDSVMKRQRVNRAEVTAAMRQYGIPRLSDVEAVILETEGSLSVVRSQSSEAISLSELGIEPSASRAE
jgi:uncharacterized membrane protein YcaP (DUF421 family)